MKFIDGTLRSMNSLADSILRVMPDLQRELDDAQMNVNAVSYLGRSMAISTLTFIFVFIAMTAVLMTKGVNRPLVVLLTSLVSALFLFAINITTPKIRIQSRAKNVERNLVFGLEALEIEISSSVPFHVAVVNIASGGYGMLSEEFKRVMEDVEKNMPFTEALRESARRTPSRYYRRVIWQITNAIETGADILDNVTSLIEELNKEQEIEGREYGSKLTPIVTMYMLLGVIIPALLGTILLVASSFSNMRSIIQASTYWMLVVLTVLIQLVFIYNVKFRRPSILGELSMAETKKITFTNVTEQFKALLKYAGIRDSPEKFIVKYVVVTIILSLLLGQLMSDFMGMQTTLTFVILMLFLWSVIYSNLNLMVDARGNQMALILPDALRLIASNIRAGMTTNQALFTAQRPEFGLLGEEIKRMGGETFIGKPLKEALMNIKNRIRSPSLDMSIALIAHGLESGIGLDNSLLRIADVLRRREFVMKEVKSMLMTNVYMIIFVIAIGAPTLYAISSFFSNSINELIAKSVSTLPMNIARGNLLFTPAPSTTITAGFLSRFSIVSLVATSILGSLMLGLIGTGKAREGMRYMLLLILSSIIVYFVVNAILIRTVGGIFQ